MPEYKVTIRVFEMAKTIVIDAENEDKAYELAYNEFSALNDDYSEKTLGLQGAA